jgi:hypothetical protein
METALLGRGGTAGIHAAVYFCVGGSGGAHGEVVKGGVKSTGLV